MNCPKCKTPLEFLVKYEYGDDYGCPHCLQIYTVSPFNKSKATLEGSK